MSLNVRLLLLTIFYAIMGGYLFRAVEQPNEQQIKSGVGDLIDWHVTELWQLTWRLNVLHEVTSLYIIVLVFQKSVCLRARRM